MNWCVTGASGLIGRAVTQGLIERGQHVTALSRHAADTFRTRNDGLLHPMNYDMTGDPDVVARLSEEDTVLVMLASHVTMSMEPAELGSVLACDTYGHMRLAERLRTRLLGAVYASSSTVYGFPSELPVDESAPLRPWSVYSLAKIASERMLGDLFSEWRIPLSVLRIAQVYGPGAPLGGALYGFLSAAARGTAPNVTCSPDSCREYCHVLDIAGGVIAAGIHRKAGVYNLGTGCATTISDLASICCAAAGTGVRPHYTQGKPAGNMWLDIRKAREAFGYTPRIDIREGIGMEHERLKWTFGKDPENDPRDR